MFLTIKCGDRAELANPNCTVDVLLDYIQELFDLAGEAIDLCDEAGNVKNLPSAGKIRADSVLPATSYVVVKIDTTAGEDAPLYIPLINDPEFKVKGQVQRKPQRAPSRTDVAERGKPVKPRRKEESPVPPLKKPSKKIVR
eukprot:TRINITY_DN9561_c0_g1_i1.p1 TRINITY_DN9561_c0_g1~~TRINITY_DN9561_c0_g1_i1.p1  ORF type:complete len:141 (+),score=10.64 TRINITY_DN9561_c0_g1_i1:266-688(+)